MPAHCCCRGYLIYCWYVYHGVDYAVHHHSSASCPTLLECVPLELTEHGGNATCYMVVSSDEPGCTSLHHFQFVDVAGSVWIPYQACVLHLWVIECREAQRLGSPWTLVYVALKETSGCVGFLPLQR